MRLQVARLCVAGLELGSDDICQILYGNKEEQPVITHLEEYIVDRKQRTVFDGNDKIIFTNKEFAFLLYFIENRNIVVTREQILEKCGEPIISDPIASSTIQYVDWLSSIMSRKIVWKQASVYPRNRLADSMADMKESLKIADEEERKFLQSISHDLKTVL
ncbi:winged helix-turn-helix domain-containing protein [Cohnella sp. GCM10020058]|uniref:winged helix-turn-helix domain-containing protein n=1 Tax=Cohnella sp. GCM10020058 TaxID=3317330 RepID=UPI00363B2B98